MVMTPMAMTPMMIPNPHHLRKEGKSGGEKSESIRENRKSGMKKRKWTKKRRIQPRRKRRKQNWSNQNLLPGFLEGGKIRYQLILPSSKNQHGPTKKILSGVLQGGKRHRNLLSPLQG
jgi:hypothetical protein